MAIEDFECAIKVKPVETWINEEDADHCHVCILKPLTEYYMGALKEANASEQAKKLEDAWASGDPLTIARELDKIKIEVGDILKKELISLDCFAQSYEPIAE